MSELSVLDASAQSENFVRKDLFDAVNSRRFASLDRFRPEHVRMAMRRVDSLETGWCHSDGRPMLMLASNNYLGLAGDRRLIEAGLAALDAWGNSTSGSRLLNGTNSLHLELEHRLAEFKHAEAAAIFPSGYMANVGVISALVGRSDVVIMDELAHASIIDGARVARARVMTFAHQSVGSLEAALRRVDAQASVLIAVDGVYSMDGDFAMLPNIIEVGHAHGARVLVDDAHATGVAGPAGRGTAAHFGMSEPDLVTGTLSKAFGVTGGFVSGTSEIVEFIKHNARSFIFSTSMSPVTTASLLRAVEIIGSEPERREHLWGITRYLRDGLQDLGFDTGLSETPIIPIMLTDEEQMLDLVVGMDRDNIFASPVAYPACPKDTPRVRLSLNSQHTYQDMDFILDSAQSNGRALGIIS